MNTTMTASTLIAATESQGTSLITTVAKARHWLETTRAFALNSTDDKAPNRMPIARDCTIYLDKLSNDNYTSAVNDIKMALQGIVDLEQGSITV